MLPVQPTTTVTIDEAVFEVSKMSPEVQSMISYLDDWRQKEVDTTSELLLVRGALKDLQNTLLATIQKEREAAVAAAADVVSEVTDVESKPVAKKSKKA